MRSWPRYCEMLLALWLLASGWVLPIPDPIPYRITALASGCLIVTVDALSILRVLRYAYLLVPVLAAILFAVARWALAPGSAESQNLIGAALLLATFGILPTEPALPPQSWRDFPER